MNQPDWNSLAGEFSTRVLQITDCDTNGVIIKAARSIARGRCEAGDFGCGVGASTRLLAPLFDSIVGVDYAAELLGEAKRLTTAGNVRYLRANLAGGNPLRLRVDAAFCVNCLIQPDHSLRLRITRRIARCLRPDGRSLFVVPAMESVMRTYQTLIRIGGPSLQGRVKAQRAVRRLAAEELVSPSEGIVKVGGVLTKHYLQDELTEFLAEGGFVVEAIRRVEYPWSVELDGAPNWLGPPSPWDWMAVASLAGGRKGVEIIRFQGPSKYEISLL